MSKRDDEAAVFERVSHKLKTVGIEVAVDSLISVAGDPKAPSPARATAGTTLLRAAGMIVTGKEHASGGKPPSEMSPDEVTAALAQLRQDLAARAPGDGSGDDDAGVFE